MQIIGPFRLNPSQAPQPQSRVAQPSGPEASGRSQKAQVDQLDLSPRAQSAGQVEGMQTVGGDMRLDKIADIRRQIAEGTYDTPEKLDLALGRMLDQMG